MLISEEEPLTPERVIPFHAAAPNPSTPYGNPNSVKCDFLK